ncbi:MAG: ribosome maturation factor RimM [Gammaproteobacteria bacterium]|nr:ribosome maturation factor RimM [Gammaproteobacteria bacterium]
MRSQSESETPLDTITLGVINGVFGIKGWVKVYSSTDPIENILEYKTWRLKQKNQEVVVKLADGRRHGKGIVAKFEGYDDRNAAETLLKAEINVSVGELPKLSEGEYYWRDLVGLEVINMDGKSYGLIDYMMPTVANDVMVIKSGDAERLIPFIQGVYVLNVDLDAKAVQVDWPEDF